MACIGQIDMGPGGAMGGIKIDSKKEHKKKKTGRPLFGS